MSVQALAWALAVPTGSATRKAVLLSLANCHNAHTGNCYPRVPTIAREADVSDRTVQRSLRDLEAAGLITKHETFRADGSQGANHYTLHMTPSGDTESPLEPELEPSEETYVSSANAGDSVEKDPFDLLWDACEEYVCRAPSEKSPRGAYAKLVHEMFDVGLTPADVRRRARAYRKRFPTMELTVAALAKWGEELDRGKRTLTEGGRATDGTDSGTPDERLRGTAVPASDPPSVSVLPPEENARRMRELAASLGGSVVVMDMNTGEIVEGALDGADGYLEGLSAPSSATLTEGDRENGDNSRVVDARSPTTPVSDPTGSAPSVSASASPHEPHTGAQGGPAPTLPVGSPHTTAEEC